MLDGRVLEASQVEYKPFAKPPLQRESWERAEENTLRVAQLGEILAQAHELSFRF